MIKAGSALNTWDQHHGSIRHTEEYETDTQRYTGNRSSTLELTSLCNRNIPCISNRYVNPRNLYRIQDYTICVITFYRLLHKLSRFSRPRCGKTLSANYTLTSSCEATHNNCMSRISIDIWCTAEERWLHSSMEIMRTLENGKCVHYTRIHWRRRWLLADIRNTLYATAHVQILKTSKLKNNCWMFKLGQQ